MAGVTLSRVNKTFAGHAAVKDVSLDLHDGEFLVLVGPSGCGKTTLLRMIAGLEPVTSGSVFIGDRDVTALPPKQRDIAMVFQDYALYPHLTVEQNLGIGLKLRRVPKAERAERVRQVAEILGLATLLKRKPAQLSGGQQQRVAIGRAMVREPAVYLLDEPLSNLDAQLRAHTRAELARLRDRLRVTTVYVTHDQIEAMTLGDRVAVLKDGVLQQVATPRELFDHPENAFVAGFIGSPDMNLVHADVVERRLLFGGHDLPVPSGVTLPSGRIIVGIRPSKFSQIGPDAPPATPRMEVTVDVVELLGEEMRVMFPGRSPIGCGLRIRAVSHEPAGCFRAHGASRRGRRPRNDRVRGLARAGRGHLLRETTHARRRHERPALLRFRNRSGDQTACRHTPGRRALVVRSERRPRFALEKGRRVNATLGPGGRGRALRARIAIAATLVVVAVAMASGVAAGSAPTAHDGSAADPVKLTFMSNAQSAGIEAAWAELIAAYEKANPNVKITRVPVAYANYKTTAKLRASSSSAPDLIEGDSSPGGILASLATPGLLLPADKYAAKYNWKKTFGPLIRQLYLSKDGTKVGSGNIYGVPDFAEILGVFYNKSILAKLGLKEPKTFAEFEASLEKAKSAGVTPLMIGGLDKWPWVHAYALLADHFGSPSALINWYNARPGASIVSPGTTKAATVLQQWVKNGYFEDGANGVSDGDAVARFGKGLSLYKIDGPWETEVEHQGAREERRVLLAARCQGRRHSSVHRLDGLGCRDHGQEQESRCRGDVPQLPDHQDRARRSS